MVPAPSNYPKPPVTHIRHFLNLGDLSAAFGTSQYNLHFGEHISSLQVALKDFLTLEELFQAQKWLQTYADQ